MLWIIYTITLCIVQSRQDALVAEDNDDWIAFEENHYLFVMDGERETDQTLPAANAICRAKHARLVSIETVEEMSFVKKQIRSRQTELGHGSAHDQWWTSGVAYHGRWMWNNGHHSPITVGELKRAVVPVRKEFHQLALRQNKQGWRLRILPENYKLRYICERAVIISQHLVRTTEEKLLDKLFFYYDVDARGVARASQTLSVNIDFSLVRIQDLEERKQVLTTMGVIVTEWVDLRLQWNPANYDNVTSLAVHSSRIWLPELTIMNGVEEQVVDNFERMRAVVNPSGLVHWEPGGVFQTTCDMDIKYFPFDTQKCYVRVGTWAYYSLKVNMSAEASDMDLSNFHLNGEWELIKTSTAWNSTVLPCCETLAYPHIDFIMHLQRRRVYYVINIVVPCSLLSLLMLVMFWVPQHAGERVTGIVTILLAFTVFLHMLSDIVPRTSLQIPIIVIYLACTMSLGTLSVCMTLVLTHLYHNCPVSPPPSFTLPWIRARLDRNMFRKEETSPTNEQNYEGKKYMFQSSDGEETGYVTQTVTPPHLIDCCHSEGLDNAFENDAERKSKSREGSPAESVGSSQNTCRSSRKRSNEPRLSRQDKILRLVDANDCKDGSCSRSTSASDDEAVSDEDPITYNRRDEWQELVRLLDRIFFLFVSIAMVATALYLFLVPLYNDSSIDG